MSKSVPLDLEMAKKHLEMIAIRSLAIRDHFSSEIYTKLAREFTRSNMEIRHDLIDETIQKLQSQKYLKDEELVVKYSQKLLASGKGPLYIRAKLRSLDLSETLIKTGLNSLSKSDIRQQIAILKSRRREDPPEKLLRFLYSRGFGFTDAISN